MKVSTVLSIAAAVAGVAGSAKQQVRSDTVLISTAEGKSCSLAMFGEEEYLPERACLPMDPFGLLRSRTVSADDHVDRSIGTNRCVLAVFTDQFCTSDGLIIEELEPTDSKNDITGDFAFCQLQSQPDDDLFQSVMWSCGDDINPGWQLSENATSPWPTNPDDVDDDDDDDDADHIISARSISSGSSNSSISVEATRLHDHVTLSPADNTECNSAQSRDTDTKKHGHCHSFKKPFLSARATISRGRITHFNKGHDCVALVFSDYKCKDNGIELIDLNDEAALGVCHNAYLYGNLPAHSWMWLCKREVINSHLGSSSDSDASSDSDDVSTSFNNMDCSTTTQYGSSTRVLTDFITNTHVSTAVVTKTTTTIKTSTDVVAHHHTRVVPFSSAIKVCNVEVFHSEL
ncbi:hypothetical protein AUEXF2481DRAFT_3656 [Aureobasidium subglaciale EXF-2481]|uniref:Uncharacterized protein n=1 Tax=Aureobasidium subglaciale (strain EXF-2481) TaxID=1043005 RepID=A0A074ZEA0_AURSE|nr:uncharacterized protein AUEXF2481DRAFT_3656 [Aureobasidium subglaciale EXF-2481]KAI5217126.1 hypothetical protein E4T41_09004 [Aureobasidium subglaciale]KAI5223270.1 hypothetical protein E4T40_04596 [Aureobasidium subglaciale]KAI5254932.1 hypothetical protein E4T46_09038 [Aureobasidium subglaciale]KEQ96976.1 hypothetical protein AUEXF2481DRAFT_3656 [Aureobasidium subglaciale EXF-2481]